jgi:FkbM family methyltransferase
VQSWRCSAGGLQLTRMLQKLAQRALIRSVRPYVAAELPAWGSVYAAMIGSYKRDSFWSDAPIVRGRNKLFGFESEYDLRRWADRIGFFLGRWYDLPSQLLICAVRGKVIVDIGANRGEFSLAAAAMDPTAKVIAFEPNPTIASILKRDLRHNGIVNVDVRECGLGDRTEVLTLHVPFVNSGSASFGGFESDGFVIKDVPVRVADEELAGTKPHLIKIDVEGFELKVLKGLTKTIKASRPIIETELMEENLARCQTSRQDVEQFMAGLGYRGFGMALRRNGREHELKLIEIGNTWDVVWLPDELSPDKLHASTRGLRSFARPRESISIKRV